MITYDVQITAEISSQWQLHVIAPHGMDVDPR